MATCVNTAMIELGELSYQPSTDVPTIWTIINWYLIPVMIEWSSKQLLTYSHTKLTNGIARLSLLIKIFTEVFGLTFCMIHETDVRVLWSWAFPRSFCKFKLHWIAWRCIKVHLRLMTLWSLGNGNDSQWKFYNLVVCNVNESILV